MGTVHVVQQASHTQSISSTCATMMIIAVCALVLATAAAAPIAESRDVTTPVDISCAGIWDRSNSLGASDFDLIRGVQAGVKWSSLEPKDNRGELETTELDAALTKVAKLQKGGCLYAQISVGPDAPSWLYSNGVPKVMPTPGKPKFKQYPYYLDANYEKYFHRMINSTATYLRNHKYASKVAFVQMDYGCTGDGVAYKEPPIDKKYSISSSQWQQFADKTAAYFKEVFESTGTGPAIPLLSNGVQDDWTIKNVKAAGIKGNAWVRFHHLNGERSWIQKWQKNMLNVQEGQQFLFTRAEMDQTPKMMPVFSINPRLGFYWAAINGLNQGLLVHDVTASAFGEMRKLNYRESIDLFNKYAPQIWPDRATGAFIALHEGLDANDKDKYPESKYGRGDDVARAKKICSAHAEFGCRLDDTSDALTKGQVLQRHTQKGYNDVGFDIWPTNYQRWLEQIDADVTSQGIFRVGGTLNAHSSPYSRFARTLLHHQNKTGMFFKLHEDFARLNPIRSLRFRVVWYDSAVGSWQLKYKSTSGSESIGHSQSMVGGKKWNEALFTLPDAAMDRSYDRGSDFKIVSKDSTDAVFHMIEIARA